jgi:NAD(P)-dependent dehydrogenase (short-subunit alcohol dehydrogenase family)
MSRVAVVRHRVAVLDLQGDTVAPPIIDTPMARQAEARGRMDVDAVARMTPVGRAGTPEDVAAACEFLCSDDAGFITGQQIGVNGGWRL